MTVATGSQLKASTAKLYRRLKHSMNTLSNDIRSIPLINGMQKIGYSPSTSVVYGKGENETIQSLNYIPSNIYDYLNNAWDG